MQDFHDRVAVITGGARTLATDDVAQLVLDGVRRDDLVIHPHKEAEGFFRKRAERIAQSFGSAL